MPSKNSSSTRSIRKKVLVSAPQLPETYNGLLADYVGLLQEDPTNPYEFSIRQRITGNFRVKGQIDYAKSPHISNFMKTPDTLAQELPAAKDMLKKLDKFADQTIRALTKLNSMNLFRLRKRSIRNQIIPGLAITGSILGLLLDFQDILAISIEDAFAGVSGINISLALKLLISSIIAFAVVISIGNWMITTPRIGLVDAFGDILKIEMSNRNLGE